MAAALHRRLEKQEIIVMMKSLYLITFHPTDTQFVVEQEHAEKALESAIEANMLVGEMPDIDITDKKYYAIEEINSFEKLKIHLKRQDYYAETDDTVIFDND